MIEVSVDKFTKINLEKCPHILIGGSTGSGKSYLLKHMLKDIFQSKDCRVVIVDPKCVDYQCMLGEDRLIMKIDNDWPRVLRLLGSLEKEMRERYKYLKDRNYVDWSSVLMEEDTDGRFNKLERDNELNEIKKKLTDMYGESGEIQGIFQQIMNTEENMRAETDGMTYESPLWGSKRIVLVIDELADLIYSDRAKTNLGSRGMMEYYLIKLATLGRASGIHLVLGTQRPDATILSGQLRANIPTRIGLRVVNNVERRIILGDSCKDLGERVLFYNGEYKSLAWELE